MKTIILSIIAGALIITGAVYYSNREIKEAEIEEGVVNIYHFWAKGCSYCAKQEKWLNGIEERYDVNIVRLEISKHAPLLSELLEMHSVPKNQRGAVPATFVGDKYFIGFDQNIGKLIEDKIKECIKTEDCFNPLKN